MFKKSTLSFQNVRITPDFSRSFIPRMKQSPNNAHLTSQICTLQLCQHCLNTILQHWLDHCNNLPNSPFYNKSLSYHGRYNPLA